MTRSPVRGSTSRASASDGPSGYVELDGLGAAERARPERARRLRRLGHPVHGDRRADGVVVADVADVEDVARAVGPGPGGHVLPVGRRRAVDRVGAERRAVLGASRTARPRRRSRCGPTARPRAGATPRAPTARSAAASVTVPATSIGSKPAQASAAARAGASGTHAPPAVRDERSPPHDHRAERPTARSRGPGSSGRRSPLSSRAMISCSSVRKMLVAAGR